MIVFDKYAQPEVARELSGLVKQRAEYTTFDRGDLCSEIDVRIGDLIERTAHRYLPREVAKGMRREVVEDLADRIITWDNDHGNGEANCHG